MTKKIKLVETFDSVSSISLVEDNNKHEALDKKSRVDGKYIIGMIEGQFFQPDGMSRNQRWYPRKLWEKALNSSDVKNRFLTSTMFGEIGHSDGPVEDLTLRNGCASHFIDEMWIDNKGRGMGRAYILNTPTGQLLKTYLGAGCKLKVSTRGEGLYKEGEYHDGCPIIDDDTYELQTADFVLNPGFLETSAVLKEEYEKSTRNFSEEQTKQIQETIAHIKKEGEQRMTLDVEAYVAELKEELKAVKAENKSLNEQLQAKDRELLQKQFNESAEIKKLNEEFKPFKDMKVSAKTLNETLKRSQDALKKVKGEKVQIEEELKNYKEKCGSLEEIDEATELSAKSLKIVEEYRKLGTPEDLKAMKENSEKLTEDFKELQKVAENAEKLLETHKKLVESNNSLKEKMTETKKGEDLMEKAINTIKSYRKLVGSLAEAKQLSESVVSNDKQGIVKVSEALDLSRKAKCSIKEAAKMIKENGVEKATEILKSKDVTSKVNESLENGEKLVEEVAQLDKVNSVPAEKTAKDFLAHGMVKNYFNHDALGKEFTNADINALNPDANVKAAGELLKKYQNKIEVEKAPKVDGEKSVEAAEAEAKKLLK